MLSKEERAARFGPADEATEWAREEANRAIDRKVELRWQEEDRRSWQYRLDRFLRDLLGPLVYGLGRLLFNLMLPLVVGVAGLFLLISPCLAINWLTSPTAEERAAQGAARLAWIEEISRKEVEAYGKKYVATCRGAPYPSSQCPAYYVYVGDADADLGRMIAEGTEEERDEHPCFEGQVKGNRRSGLYHLPEGQFYAATRADVLCYDSAEAARDAGYRPSPR